MQKSPRNTGSTGFFMAEREGFEPSVPLWGTHDFQSCALDQLSHLSAAPFYLSEKRGVCQENICLFTGIFPVLRQSGSSIRPSASAAGQSAGARQAAPMQNAAGLRLFSRRALTFPAAFVIIQIVTSPVRHGRKESDDIREDLCVRRFVLPSERLLDRDRSFEKGFA